MSNTLFSPVTSSAEDDVVLLLLFQALGDVLSRELGVALNSQEVSDSVNQVLKRVMTEGGLSEEVSSRMLWVIHQKMEQVVCRIEAAKGAIGKDRS